MSEQSDAHAQRCQSEQKWPIITVDRHVVYSFPCTKKNVRQLKIEKA